MAAKEGYAAPAEEGEVGALVKVIWDEMRAHRVATQFLSVGPILTAQRGHVASCATAACDSGTSCRAAAGDVSFDVLYALWTRLMGLDRPTHGTPPLRQPPRSPPPHNLKRIACPSEALSTLSFNQQTNYDSITTTPSPSSTSASFHPSAVKATCTLPQPLRRISISAFSLAFYSHRTALRIAALFFPGPICFIYPVRLSDTRFVG